MCVCVMRMHSIDKQYVTNKSLTTKNTSSLSFSLFSSDTFLSALLGEEPTEVLRLNLSDNENRFLTGDIFTDHVDDPVEDDPSDDFVGD